jgi:hypothetical protein
MEWSPADDKPIPMVYGPDKWYQDSGEGFCGITGVLEHSTDISSRGLDSTR